jgi:hypothetical protein
MTWAEVVRRGGSGAPWPDVAPHCGGGARSSDVGRGGPDSTSESAAGRTLRRCDAMVKSSTLASKWAVAPLRFQIGALTCQSFRGRQKNQGACSRPLPRRTAHD